MILFLLACATPPPFAEYCQSSTQLACDIEHYAGGDCEVIQEPEPCQEDERSDDCSRWYASRRLDRELIPALAACQASVVAPCVAWQEVAQEECLAECLDLCDAWPLCGADVWCRSAL